MASANKAKIEKDFCENFLEGEKLTEGTTVDDKLDRMMTLMMATSNTMNANNATMNATLTGIKGNVNNLTAEIASARQEIQAAQVKVDAVTNDVVNLKDKIKVLESKKPAREDDPLFISQLEKAKRSLSFGNVEPGEWEKDNLKPVLMKFGLTLDQAKAVRVLDVWETPESRDEGRIHATFDSEGTLNYVWTFRFGSTMERVLDANGDPVMGDDGAPMKRKVKMQMYITSALYDDHRALTDLQAGIRKLAAEEGIGLGPKPDVIGSNIHYLGNGVAITMRIPGMRRYEYVTETDPRKAWAFLKSRRTTQRTGEIPRSRIRIPSISYREKRKTREDAEDVSDPNEYFLTQVDGNDTLSDSDNDDYRLVTQSPKAASKIDVPGASRPISPNISNYFINMSKQAERINTGLGKTEPFTVQYKAEIPEGSGRYTCVVVPCHPVVYKHVVLDMFKRLTMQWRLAADTGTFKVIYVNARHEQAGVQVGAMWRVMWKPLGMSAEEVTVHTYDTDFKVMCQGAAARPFWDMVLDVLLRANIEANREELLSLNLTLKSEVKQAAAGLGQAKTRLPHKPGGRGSLLNVGTHDSPGESDDNSRGLPENTVCPSCKKSKIYAKKIRCSVCMKKTHRGCLTDRKCQMCRAAALNPIPPLLADPYTSNPVSYVPPHVSQVLAQPTHLTPNSNTIEHNSPQSAPHPSTHIPHIRYDSDADEEVQNISNDDSLSPQRQNKPWLQSQSNHPTTSIANTTPVTSAPVSTWSLSVRPMAPQSQPATFSNNRTPPAVRFSQHIPRLQLPQPPEQKKKKTVVPKAHDVVIETLQQKLAMSEHQKDQYFQAIQVLEKRVNFLEGRHFNVSTGKVTVSSPETVQQSANHHPPTINNNISVNNYPPGGSGVTEIVEAVPLQVTKKTIITARSGISEVEGEASNGPTNIRYSQTLPENLGQTQDGSHGLDHADETEGFNDQNDMTEQFHSFNAGGDNTNNDFNISQVPKTADNRRSSDESISECL